MKSFHKLNITADIIDQMFVHTEYSQGTKPEVLKFIQGLSRQWQIELLALYMLGRGGIRSFNLALKSAAKVNEAHLPDMLAEKGNLAELIRKGLSRHKRHS